MTTLFKKVAIASALALTLGTTSMSANAAVDLIGTGTTSFDTKFYSNGAFTTYYNFTVTPNSDSGLGESSMVLRNSSVGVLLSTLALYTGLYSASSTPVGSAIASDTYTSTGSGAQHPYLGASTTLTAGTVYTLVTTGTAYGATLTNPVSFNTSFTLAPVPEPETYAMLLAGLGVMGFVARRQKKNKA